MEVDWSNVTGFQEPYVSVNVEQPPSAAEQLFTDPSNLLLLAILAVLIVGVVLLKKRGKI